jgi:hypothetical protein
LGEQVNWDKGGTEPAVSENMNGRDSSLDIGINGRKARKWILSQMGSWGGGGRKAGICKHGVHTSQNIS